jgi:hypothetical protein
VSVEDLSGITLDFKSSFLLEESFYILRLGRAAATKKKIHPLPIMAIAIGDRLKELRIDSGPTTVADFARKHGLPKIQYGRSRMVSVTSP